MPYCLYVRKSRADAEAEARGEGETLSRHITILLDLAKRRGLDVTQIYREIVSGETIAARPVMQQVLQEVEQGAWEGVLVMEVERLARGDTIDQGIVAQTFKYSNCKIITPMKDYSPDNEYDEEYFEFGLFMSRREYKTINRRLQTGRRASANEGKFVGSIPPYGYERVRLVGAKGNTLKPVPEEAEIVKLIYKLYTVGVEQPDGSCRRLGISLIVRYLNDAGIKPRISKDWSFSSVRGILCNPVYIGKIHWNSRPQKKKVVDGRVVVYRPRVKTDKYILRDGLHPALISEETFNLAQELLSKNPPNPISQKGVLKNPLSGIVFCADCGLGMRRRPYGSRREADTLMCANTACKNVSSDLKLVEARILEALREWLSEYRVKWETEYKNEFDDVSIVAMKEANLRRLEKEFSTLKKQLDSTHDLLEQGVYTTDQFLERSRAVSERMAQNERDRIALGQDIEKEQAREVSRVLIIPKVEKLLDVYESLPDAKSKNDMLKEVLEKVVYKKETRARWSGGSLDNFEIVIYPRIPSSVG